MSNIGDPMTSGTVPVVGTGGTGYASTINAFLAEVKQRLEAKIPLSSFLAGLLDMANNAIANLSYAGLYAQASTPTAPLGTLQNFAGNLYWVGNSGAVQITNGAAINSAAIGGITGDYGGSNPAQWRFVDADTEYYGYDDFGAGKWAYVWGRGFDIAGSQTSVNRVRLQSNVTASYALTIPNAPASQVILQVDNTGAVTYSNTLANNANLTLQGTGVVKHGDYTITQDGLSCFASSGSAPTFQKVGSVISTVVAANSTVNFPIRVLKKGSRIKSIRIAGLCTVDPTLYAVVDQVGNSAAVLATTSSGGPVSATGVITLTLNTPLTYADDEFIYLAISAAGGGSFTLYTIRTTYDTP